MPAESYTQVACWWGIMLNGPFKAVGLIFSLSSGWRKWTYVNPGQKDVKCLCRWSFAQVANLPSADRCRTAQVNQGWVCLGQGRLSFSTPEPGDYRMIRHLATKMFSFVAFDVLLLFHLSAEVTLFLFLIQFLTISQHLLFFLFGPSYCSCKAATRD